VTPRDTDRLSTGIAPSTVHELLEALEAPAPSPCGGSAAALSAAMAASLVTLVARTSPAWDEAAGIAAQSATLRARLVVLADEDVAVFAAALEALEAARETGGARDRLLGVALSRAADVPLAIATAAADVAELAADAALHGNDATRADAAAAATLAEAAARAAAHLVEVNLTTLPDDARLADAEAACAQARAARERALAHAT
jgi:formiminotetrahydrofolate cyclodeaminase